MIKSNSIEFKSMNRDNFQAQKWTINVNYVSSFDEDIRRPLHWQTFKEKDGIIRNKQKRSK